MPVKVNAEDEHAVYTYMKDCQTYMRCKQRSVITPSTEWGYEHIRDTEKGRNCVHTYQ